MSGEDKPRSGDPMLDAKRRDYAPADVSEQASCMEEAPWADADMSSSDLSSVQAAPAEEQTAAPKATLEVAFFGKVHTGITVQEFREKAKDFHATHAHELKSLYSAVSDYRSFYKELNEPDGWADRATAATVSGVTRVRNWFSSVSAAPRPDIEEFDALLKRLEDLAGVLAGQDLGYPAVHQMGIDLNEVRLKLEDLNRRVARFQAKALESAEGATHVLETVEGTSFQLLAIAPKIMGWDPYREAAYKIGLIVARGGARALGGYAAYKSGRRALQEVFQVLKQDVPPLLVDYISRPFSKLLEAKGVGPMGKAVLESSLRVCLGVACELVLTVLDKEEGNAALTRADAENIIKRAATDTFSEIVGHVMRLPASDSLVKKIVNSTIESTATTLFDDYLTARQTAKQQNRPVWNVFAENIPWTILKIVQAAFLGTTNKIVDQRMAQKHEANERKKQEESGAPAPKKLNVAESEMAASEKVAAVKALPPAPEYKTDSRKKVKKVDQKPRKPRPPILSDKETEDHWWKQTGLAWEMANGLRQAAWKGNEIIVIRKPSHAVFLYQQTLSYFPKAGFVDAKSAKYGKHPGLVVEPMLGPPSGPTHHVISEKYPDGTRKPADVLDAERRQQSVLYDELKVGWNKKLKKATDAGCLVRDDGVLFHPEMLAYHAKDHPQDMQAARKAYKMLMELNGAGVTKVTREGFEGHAVLEKAIRLGYTREEFDQTHALLARAKVGFFSDVDLAHVVHADTGEVRNAGKGNEIQKLGDAKKALETAQKGDDAAAIADAKKAVSAAFKEFRAVRREQERLDRNMSEERRKDISPPPGFYDGLPRKKSIKTPHRQAVVQHGSDSLYVGGQGRGYYAGGEVVMVFPDGSFRVVQSRLDPLAVDANSMHYAEFLRRRHPEFTEAQIEQRRAEFAERSHNVDILEQYRAISGQHINENARQLYVHDMPRDAVGDPTNGVEASGKAPKPDYNKHVARIPRIQEKAKDPVGATLRPVSPHSVEAGIVHRSLRTSSRIIAEFFRRPGSADIERIQSRYSAHFAVTDRGKALLVAVRLPVGHSVAYGLASLAMAYHELTLKHGSDVRVWFELHSQYRPMTTGRIINRIGPPAVDKFPDVPREWRGVASNLVTSFKVDKDAKRLRAWRGAGTTGLLAPDPKRYGADMAAVKLADVWEHAKTGALYRTPTRIKGRPVAVLFSTLAPTAIHVEPAAEEAGH